MVTAEEVSKLRKLRASAAIRGAVEAALAGAGVTLVAAVRTSAEVEVTSVADTLAAVDRTSEEVIPAEAAMVEAVTVEAVTMEAVTAAVIIGEEIFELSQKERQVPSLPLLFCGPASNYLKTPLPLFNSSR